MKWKSFCALWETKLMINCKSTDLTLLVSSFLLLFLFSFLFFCKIQGMRYLAKVSSWLGVIEFDNISTV